MNVRTISPLFVAACMGVYCTASSTVNGADNLAPIYLSDMSKCEPAASLSNAWQPEKWRLLSYQTENVQGQMLAAQSYIEAPEVRLPVSRKGWYAIHLGVWNPDLMYDGKPIVKARLSSRPVFQQIHPAKSADTQNATFLEEVFLCEADLTNESYIAFGKSNGLQPRSSYVAYVKLVPLSAEQVQDIQKHREDEASRNLVATFDGSSIFHFSDCSTLNHVLEWVEKLQHTDTKKVLWAATYGDRTGFPTKNKSLRYLGAEKHIRAEPMAFGNPYRRGHVQMQRFFKQCADDDVVVLKHVADHTHSLGMKFDLMYRIGFLGGLGVSELWDDNFVQKNPHVRQVSHAGAPLQKGSLAFPEIQDLILAQIEESCGMIDADGINLCFVRGPHFLLWEKPVRDAFEKKYKESAANIAIDDPRIDVVRCEIVTHFMTRVKEKLAELGKARGRDFTLSVWVWPHEQGVWLGSRPVKEGLDVEEWIRRGLLNSVICQEGIDDSYVELGKKHDCEFVLFTGYRGDKTMSPTSINKAVQQGVNSFACWDIDAAQNDPTTWHWLRQTGHRNALKKLQDQPELMKRQLIQLQKFNGHQVDAGLVDAVYSGG